MKSRSLSNSGVALIIVLGFLVIITGLVMAFFTSVSTELQASRNFASGVTTRQLADSAVGVVMGQLREATTRPNATWASQPGALRVYGAAGAVSPNLDSIYKLYSSNNMVVSSTDALPLLASDFQNDLEAAWHTKAAFWTDLNSPILVPDTTNPGKTVPRFPVIDPRAYAIQTTDAYSTVPDAGTVPTDPKWKNIEGFWYNTASTVNGIVGPAATDVDRDKQRLPMPTRWIYVLQDGTLTVPDAGDGKNVSWSVPAKSPTKANPIVGRVAFWTDDESSKVNLNTAGGYADVTLPTGYDANSHAGSYWDTPHFYTEFDRGMVAPESNGETGNPKAGRPLPGKGGLAIAQLLQGEYQRYPGHPSTTSIGLIFRNYLTSEQLYTILPRLGISNSQGSIPGSSKGGTERVIPLNPRTAGANPFPQDFRIQPQMNRLYSSVDELLFAANSTLSITDANYHRETNDTTLKNNYALTNAAITPEFLDKMRFFITAQSRAPELNLFGRPRVTVWPVRYETATESSGLNAFDNLILFCSTVGQAPAGRPDTTTAPSGSPLQVPNITFGPSFPTSDLYRYIFTRRELPASATIPSSLVLDVNQPRNKQLMIYLQQLTEKPIPGFSTNVAQTLKAKWDQGNFLNRDQVLVEIFDYIRCANARDTTTKAIDGTSTAKKFAPYGLIMPSKSSYLNSGVVNGLGRFPTISEATLVFYYAGPKMDAAEPTKAAVDALGNTSHRKMRAFLMFSTFNPMQGYAPTGDPGTNNPKMILKVKGLGSLKITAGPYTSAPLGFPNEATTTVYRSSGGTWGGRNFGGFEGFMHTLVGGPNEKIQTSPGVNLGHPMNARSLNAGAPGGAVTNQEYYELQTPETLGAGMFEIPYATDTFNFTGTTPGSPVEVEVYYGGTDPHNLIQTVALDFPDGSGWPVPRGEPTGVDLKGTDLARAVRATAAGPGIDVRDPNLWVRVTSTGYNFGTGTTNGVFQTSMRRYYWEELNSFYSSHHGDAPGTGRSPAAANFSYQTSLQASWSFASRLAWSRQESWAPYAPLPSGTTLNSYSNRWRQILQPGDTIRSLVFCDTPSPTATGVSGPAPSNTTNTGDLRIAALSTRVTGFKPHPDWSGPQSRASQLRMADGNRYFATNAPSARPFNGSFTSTVYNLEGFYGNHVPLTGTNKFPADRAMANLPWGGGTSTTGSTSKFVNGVVRDDGQKGDYDTGIGNFPDGPFANKQDEGNIIFAYQEMPSGIWRYPIPYFGTWAYEEPGNTFTSPSRQMPSALMIGSLPSRAAEKKGWETLNFTPAPAGINHRGNMDPKDHLLLDLFHMPIVEPYPISEPFSTAGKVNLNYQIAPFNYITRSTALRAALHPLRIPILASTTYNTYKTGTGTGAAGTYDAGRPLPLATNPRKPVDRDKTIKALDDFFALGKTNASTGFFKSATQICERFLYPIATSAASDVQMQTFWNSFSTLIGDNMREKTYADLYPRVTTKSNTYTVHMKVQTLRQLPRSTAATFNTWNEGRDAVLGEYRGSTTIERYIDPADPRFKSTSADFVNPDDVSSATSLETLYRMRTVINKRFAP
jgi:uncharacterized protein (TIGR02600 family)